MATLQYLAPEQQGERSFAVSGPTLWNSLLPMCMTHYWHQLSFVHFLRLR